MNWIKCAAGVVAIAAASLGAAKTTWNLPAGYADGNFHTQNLRWFADEVKKATDGELEIVVHANASLFKLPDIKRAVQTGQVPIGEVLLSLHGNEDALFEADMIPFMAAGFDNARKLYAVQKPMLEKKLSGQGMKLLYTVGWPGNGIFSKTPMESTDAFKGAKFRAYNAVTSRLAEELGAQPTTVQVPELSQAFMTGIATTMIASPPIGVDTKAWEFLTTFYDYNAMHPKNAVLVNQRSFNRLTPEHQAAVLKVAAQAEARGWELAQKAATGAVDDLARNGIKVVKPNPQMQAGFERVSSKIIQDWVSRAGEDGRTIQETLRGR
jgi:TRAP-type C4-dicarboxylate transport system substrate-binding protein